MTHLEKAEHKRQKWTREELKVLKEFEGKAKEIMQGLDSEFKKGKMNLDEVKKLVNQLRILHKEIRVITDKDQFEAISLRLANVQKQLEQKNVPEQETEEMEVMLKNALMVDKGIKEILDREWYILRKEQELEHNKHHETA